MRPAETSVRKILEKFGQNREKKTKNNNNNNMYVYRHIYVYAGELVLVPLFCLAKSQEQYHFNKTNHSYSSQKQIKS